MTASEFKESLEGEAPPAECTATLAALWWDAHGDWDKAHKMVDDLETTDGMAVHAYLHRKEGVEWNSEYWYRRSGRTYCRPTLEEEWQALVDHFLSA
ncbi:MAG TPA: hypothetical protein VG844_11820 [Terracidiphilus sp.]|jgi:hypothetical protein|nr:hypothetical protein [Terracidiphilus sp.]